MRYKQLLFVTLIATAITLYSNWNRTDVITCVRVCKYTMLSKDRNNNSYFFRFSKISFDSILHRNFSVWYNRGSCCYQTVKLRKKGEKCRSRHVTFRVQQSNNNFAQGRDCKMHATYDAIYLWARWIIETISFVRVQSTSLTRIRTWSTYVYINKH